MVVIQIQCGSRWKDGYGADSEMELCVK